MNTGRTSIPYKGMPTGRAWNLENDDVEAIKKLPEVKYAAGMVWANQFYASHGDRKGEYYVMGHMPDYQRSIPRNSSTDATSTTWTWSASARSA